MSTENLINAVNAEVQQAKTFVYNPHKVQAEAHKAFLVDGYKRGCLFWGRQVGKSLFSVKHLEMAASYRQGPYHIVFRTHKHAKEVMWKQYLHTIPPEMIYNTNGTDLEITLNYLKVPMFIPGIGWQAIKHNTENLRSTIRLLGSDYADDDRGLKSNGMIFDEYQDQDPNNFDSVYRYFFTTTKGWAIFMGTAKGYNHWWELLEYAKQEKHKKWYYLEATWRDNPAIDPEWIAQEREEAEETGKLDIFLQEVELQFRTVAGSVFKWFDRKTHVISQLDKRLPENGTLYVTWDFGWSEGHPTAVNFVDIDNQGTWFVTDEVHGYEIDVEEVLQQIKMKAGERRIKAIIADPARPDLIARVIDKAPAILGYTVAVVSPSKGAGSVASGVQLLATKVKPKMQLVGMPEPGIYFTDNCKMTIYQMENYKYREIKENRPPSEDPMKKDDDHPDGLRYLELYLKYGIQKKSQIKAKTPKFSTYGTLLT